MIKRDPLTPCSSGDFTRRMGAAIADLDRADAALCHAWNERNDARWPRHSTNTMDKVPNDDPRVIAAEARVEDARAEWRAAHAKLVAFVSAPLELVCAVEDWRVSQWRERERCPLSAGHDGLHSFEANPADLPVSSNPDLAEREPDRRTS